MKKITTCLVILLLALFSQHLLAAEIILTIPARVEVKGPWISIGDIASIKGLKGEELTNLKEVQLGKALLPGYIRHISREEIILTLQDRGYDPNRFKLNIPDSVAVKTASVRLTKEKLTSLARDFIQNNLPYASEQTKIINRYSPPDLTLPDREYEVKFILDKENPRGEITLQAVVIVEGEVYRKVFLGFKVTILQQVYVAKRDINKGERIQLNDFKIETRGIGENQGEIITDFEQSIVQDGVVKIPLHKGDVLTTYYLTKPDLIFYGDIVQAEVLVGNIRVTTRVKALQRGKKGDFIRVENIKSGYRFKARIINSRLVRVRG